MAGQGFLKRLDTEACVQRVRQPPGQDISARPVHGCHQVKEAAAHRDVGDIGAPDMVRALDRQGLEQIGVDPVLGVRSAGTRRPIDRLKPHQAQQTTGPAAADAHALAAQVADHLTGTVERILQKQRIDAPHQRQSLRALALGRVIERGAPDRQQTALTAQAQRRVIAHHHCSPLRPAHRPDPLDAVRKYIAKTIDRLALPCAHLVRMNLVLRGDLLQRPVAAKRLKRDPRLQLP